MNKIIAALIASTFAMGAFAATPAASAAAPAAVAAPAAAAPAAKDDMKKEMPAKKVKKQLTLEEQLRTHIIDGEKEGLKDTIDARNRADKYFHLNELADPDKNQPGTGWMAMYCLNLLAIALELAKEDPAYEDVGMTPRFVELTRRFKKDLQAAPAAAPARRFSAAAGGESRRPQRGASRH